MPNVFKIDSVDFTSYLAPGGIKVEPEVLLSSNSGRSSTTGDNLVEIVATKHKITVITTPLSEAQKRALAAALSDFVVNVQAPDPETGALTTYNCYISTPAYLTLCKVGGVQYYESITMSFIEN